MDISHDFTIEKIQTEFVQIIEMYDEIQNTRIEIRQKLVQLKDIYTCLIKNNNKQKFLFCLDAFYFQYKVLNIEIDNLSRLLSLINNRMYGDYYKLYNIMLTNAASYICVDSSHCSDAANILVSTDPQVSTDDPLIRVDEPQVSTADPSKIYPIYKDLEPFREYSIIDTQSLHSDIVKIVNQIFAFYTKKSDEIRDYNINKIGISIDSFINTLEYDNNLINEQLQLYINYITFFHKTQTEYLFKLLNKILLFQCEINETLLSNTDATDGDDLDNVPAKKCVLFTIDDFSSINDV